MLDLLKDCCNCFLLSLVKKHLNEHIIYWIYNLILRLVQFLTQSYLSLLNSFLFLSRFSFSLQSLNNYFFRGFAYKSLLNRFSVLIYCIMWSSNHFSICSCFLRFLGSSLFRVQVFQGSGFSESRFFRVQVFQGPGPGSGSRF